MTIEEIWPKYQANLKAFILSKVANPDETDELLQVVLIKAYQNLHTVRCENHIKSWLFQIAHHAIIDFYRTHSKLQGITAEDLWYRDNNQTIQQKLSGCIPSMVNALPEETAGLLKAVDLGEQSQKAYASDLGISYSTLKSRVQKARKQLRGLFDQCCQLSFDREGGIADFTSKSASCKNC